MYESVLNLHSRPFHSSPNSEQVYYGHSMQKALSSARLCIDRGNGPALIIGAPGVGKTSLLMILEQHYREQFHVVNLACSRVDGRLEFLQTVLFELRQPYRGLSEGELRLSLLDFLRSDSPESEGLLLLIDDGENLSVEVLDEVRVVSNFVQDGRPRTRLVVAGGFRLEETLNDARLQSFNQRIAARSFLRNLTQAETVDYVRDQILRAGGDGNQLFGDASLQTIFELTDGCPRFISQLCDHALILCVTHGRREIDSAIVREAWSDLQCFPEVSCNNLSHNPCQFSEQSSGESGNWSIIEFGSLDDSPACEPLETWQTTAEDRSGEFTADESGTHPTDSEPMFPTELAEEDSVWQPPQAAGYNPYESQTAWNPNAAVLDHWAVETETGLSDSRESESQFSSDPQTYPEQPPALPIKPVYVAIDPFAEPFGETELVTSRFASQIAHFNRSSQDLTPDDLSCLQSLANNLDQELSSSEPVCEPDCDCPAHEESNSSSQELAIADHQDHSDPVVSEPWSDAALPAQVRFPIATEPARSAFQPPELESNSQQIAHEADSLLQQLASAFGEPIEYFDPATSERANRSPAGESGCIIRLSTDSLAGQPAERSSSATSQHSVSSELQELESLKQAIEDQNKFSAQAFDRLIFQNHGPLSDTAWRAQPGPNQTDFEHSYPEQTSSGNPLPHQDDRDMLVCQPGDEDHCDQTNSHHKEDRLPFPPTPVSTGRAERMDYQQLFDQLRNLPNT